MIVRFLKNNNQVEHVTEQVTIILENGQILTIDEDTILAAKDEEDQFGNLTPLETLFSEEE